MKAKLKIAAEGEFDGEVDEIQKITNIVRNIRKTEGDSVPLLWRIKPNKRWRISI